MNPEKREEHIAQMSKAVFRFCLSRTGSYYDAEDLAQEIMLAACKAGAVFPNEKAFYAFVWKTADNLLKGWYRAQAKHRAERLSESLPDHSFALLEEKARDSEHLLSIIRELARLSSAYRRAAVEYYINGRSVREAAARLSLSESMVKYLLFQSRKHIKEGIVMEKELGRLSYDPVELKLFFWGGKCVYYGLFEESRLRQNIVMACYYDRLTEEQLSLQLGVPTAYLEDELKKLVSYDLLRKTGIAYQSNIVIVTEKERAALREYSAAAVGKTVSEIRSFAQENLPAIRALGFYGNDMPDNSLKWMIVTLLMRLAYVDLLQREVVPAYPQDCFGDFCFRFLMEAGPADSYYMSGISSQTPNGAAILFWDVPVNGKMIHPIVDSVRADMLSSLRRRQPVTEGEKIVCSELLELGLVKKEGTAILPNFPCLNAQQRAEIDRLIAPLGRGICDRAKSRVDGIARVMADHTPQHLADYARRLPVIMLLNEPEHIISQLCESGWLLPVKDGMLATTVLMEE